VNILSKVELAVIFATYGNLSVVKQALPTVVQETARNNAALIIHDSTDPGDGRDEKWNHLKRVSHNNKHVFLLLSDNMSMGHARNTCLYLAQELFIPDYICIMEDDHRLEVGALKSTLSAMKRHYGKRAPNGLLFGLFTVCNSCRGGPRAKFEGHLFPKLHGNDIGSLGGTNSCFRCAPTSHWNNVLKGYDTDEYLISQYQTRNLNHRNYNKGFTTLIVAGGSKAKRIEN